MNANLEPDVPAAGNPPSRDSGRDVARDGIEFIERPVPLPTDLPRRPVPAAREKIP